MKNLFIAVAILLVGSANSLKAQDIAVGGESGFSLFSANGANFSIPLGANFEWDINGKLSLAGRLSFDIGVGKNTISTSEGSTVGSRFSTFLISPEVRYHFSEVFKGAYVGGFIGLGPATNNTLYFSAGGIGGYEMMLTDKLNLDISGQLGIGNNGNSSQRYTGIHFRPTVALRYVF